MTEWMCMHPDLVTIGCMATAFGLLRKQHVSGASVFQPCSLAHACSVEPTSTDHSLLCTALQADHG